MVMRALLLFKRDVHRISKESELRKLIHLQTSEKFFPFCGCTGQCEKGSHAGTIPLCEMLPDLTQRSARIRRWTGKGELIQRDLPEHGEMSGGDSDLYDLFKTFAVRLCGEAILLAVRGLIQGRCRPSSSEKPLRSMNTQLLHPKRQGGWMDVQELGRPP